ncbi:MAG: Ni/Fe-hydrogenase, b-type cytochrome subunit [Burkholderiaceae bacterium]|jgi:Ni/Fe-hydrogenase 1 B-type cytochrome subunit|nr:Ni/Fe-hydrogenase, b-type cytochrome subunit [Burkholderiaceae bacterium]
MTTVRKTYSYNDDNAALRAEGKPVMSFYVYQAMLRLWHWITVLAVVVLCCTGYLIGKPLPTLSGEASAHFLMGYIRFAHFSAGYVLGVGLIFRIYWAFVGNRYAHEIFIVPIWDPQWWREFFYELRWYLLLERYPRKYIGHNPVGQVAMFCFFVFAILMCLSGFAMYGEGLGWNSWAAHGFGWVISLVGGGNSLAVHSWHRLGMWAVVLFVMVHVYAAVREDIMSKQSMISTMVSGFRMFKD